MLTLTKKTDYALIALTHLARNAGRVVSAREIATRYQVPQPLLMNLLKICSQKDLVTSVRGAKGGYTLARDAEKITLAELVEAIEGPLRLVQCSGSRQADAAGGQNSCQVVDCCPVRTAINNLHRRLHGFLAEVTLAEVIEMATEAKTEKLAPRLAGRDEADGQEFYDETSGVPGQ